jgi:hypothetical protein
MYCREKMHNTIGCKPNHISTVFPLFELGFAVNFRNNFSVGYLFPDVFASIPRI